MADNVTVPGVGTVATDDVGGAHVQRIKRQVGADASATDFLDKATLAHTFTATGNGTTVDVSAQAMKHFSLQVKGTGAAATAWSVVLEGSLNSSHGFTTILTHNSADAILDGATVWGQIPSPMLYFRARCHSLTLGSATNIIATILGTP